MRSSYLFVVFFIVLNACNSTSTDKPVTQNPVPEEKANFIPVTSYIKGQIREMKEKGLNPIKYTIVGEHTDSVFLKFEELEGLLTEFLHPEIDSVSMVPFFKESKFLDQTIDAFTFTYEPKIQLPDSIKLNHWDVYIEPQTGNIKRVYMTKRISKETTLQLTWQSNQWCKVLTLNSSADGSSKVEKEEKISWDY